MPEDADPMRETAVKLRRSYSELYAQSALAGVESCLDEYEHMRAAFSADMDLSQAPQSPLHSGLPLPVEPVLALALLATYEYVQRSNIAKMRARANQALTTAMDLSLHTASTGSSEYSDALRRAWWMVMFVVYQSSILTASPPIITVDDPRITTHFPEFRGCREPWPLLVKSQKAFINSCCISRELARESVESQHASLRDQIQQLYTFICEVAAEADRFRCVTNYSGAEADASRNLWAMSRALIHTHLSSPNPRLSDIGLEADGKASGTARALRPSRSPRELPHLACCTLQGFYTISMLLSKVRRALCSGDLSSCYYLLDRPTPATDVQDTERLIEELQQSLNALSASIRADAVFEGLAAAAREVEDTLSATID
ncbi:hypothetical protein Asppvi_005446 [Aspergillus pseudoviridinutans]|uniref:Transcription factor domain-containing protein n=1 Tax=Aspergillus pseudoviridinutans TaxID=1517512 RepID=A0A9P3EUD8_9EURO|nr:uncharacterized protein Asppvi_005446 [Aspergillus pseudoviridinutans]GIJ86557.1 hypothetical protein Asppvi_005446 [Aspergillus pseudoviridinutans]